VQCLYVVVYLCKVVDAVYVSTHPHTQSLQQRRCSSSSARGSGGVASSHLCVHCTPQSLAHRTPATPSPPPHACPARRGWIQADRAIQQEWIQFLRLAGTNWLNRVDWLPWQPGRTHFHIQADFGLPMEEGECVDRERGHVMEGTGV